MGSIKVPIFQNPVLMNASPRGHPEKNREKGKADERLLLRISKKQVSQLAIQNLIQMSVLVLGREEA